MSELQKLNARHKMAIRLRVQGMQVIEIERQCGFTSGYGDIVLNSNLARAEIERLSGELDDSMIEGINAARELVGENAPRLAAQMIKLATSAIKEDTQLSACAQALKFAEGGVTQAQSDQTAINIYVRGENGELEKKADIFKDAAFPVGDAEAGSKALAMMEEEGNE